MTDQPPTPLHAGPRRLIVCADDYGQSPAIDAAVLALARAGALSATSALVLAPGWAKGAAALRQLPRPIDVGLHLDWTSEHARAAGHGLGLLPAMALAGLRALRPGPAEAEIHRQLDRFEQHWGGPPDHVDGHQHVQQFAGLRDALLRALQQRYRPGQRPYLRVSRVQPGSAPWLKAGLISGWGAAPLRTGARRAGWPATAVLGGVYDFRGGRARYADLLGHWLSELPDGALLMCHPALAADAGDPIGTARLAEYQVLGDPDFPSLLQARHIALVRGRDLPDLAP